MLIEENTIPDDGSQPSDLLPVERTPEIDARLREFGVDLDDPEPSEEEKRAEEERLAAEEEAKKKAEEEQSRIAAEQKAREEEDARKKAADEAEEEIEISEEEAQSIIQKQLGKDQDEQYPWEKEGRQPTEKEVLDYVAQRSADIQEQNRLAKEQKEKEAQQIIKDQEAQRAQAWEKKWNDDIEFLEKQGSLPKVLNKDDQNDPGLRARRELFEAAVNNQELDLRVAYAYFVAPKKGKQPPGDKAPIGRPDADTLDKENEDEFYYDEIHNKDLEEMATNVKIK